MSNGDFIKKLQELAENDTVPESVQVSLTLTGIAQLYQMMDGVVGTINALRKEQEEYRDSYSKQRAEQIHVLEGLRGDFEQKKIDDSQAVLEHDKMRAEYAALFQQLQAQIAEARQVLELKIAEVERQAGSVSKSFFVRAVLWAECHPKSAALIFVALVALLIALSVTEFWRLVLIYLGLPPNILDGIIKTPIPPIP